MHTHTFFFRYIKYAIVLFQSKKRRRALTIILKYCHEVMIVCGHTKNAYILRCRCATRICVCAYVRSITYIKLGIKDVNLPDVLLLN